MGQRYRGSLTLHSISRSNSPPSPLLSVRLILSILLCPKPSPPRHPSSGPNGQTSLVYFLSIYSLSISISSIYIHLPPLSLMLSVSLSVTPYLSSLSFPLLLSPSFLFHFHILCQSLSHILYICYILSLSLSLVLIYILYHPTFRMVYWHESFTNHIAKAIKSKNH